MKKNDMNNINSNNSFNSKHINRVNKEETPSKAMRNCAKKGFHIYAATVLTVTFLLSFSTAVFAGGDPIAVVNNLNEFIFGIIRAIGIILLGWGVVQVGLSMPSNDPTQRANGFLTLAGGIVITFAKEILTMIMG